jgi:peptide/nickel transport system permease protein
MARYAAGRLLQAVLSLLAVATLVFLLVRLTGDPAKFLVPDAATIETENRIRAQLGLDRPLYEQYGAFIGGLARFDLGQSFTGRPVLSILLERLGATASLALVAITIAISVSIPLGILSALNRGSPIDVVARSIALLGQSVPSFVLAILLILVFGVMLLWLPVAHRAGPESYVLPAIAMGWGAVAGIVRLMRSSMLEVLDSDYVLMARAKGLPPSVVVVRHALRNALIPVLTFTALVMAAFMNGSVVVENVFAWPGIGKTILDAVKTRDFPLVQGVVMMTAFFYIVINFIVDVLYVVVDPRIRNR